MSEKPQNKKKYYILNIILKHMPLTFGTTENIYFTDPSCILIGSGCFLAEPTCERYEVLDL